MSQGLEEKKGFYISCFEYCICGDFCSFILVHLTKINKKKKLLLSAIFFVAGGWCSKNHTKQLKYLKISLTYNRHLILRWKWTCLWKNNDIVTW